jgi:ribonuclease BN (tRNA processing enzyme)
MEVTIVGSGTLLPDAERGSAAHLVETESARVLLDCGSGALHGMQRLNRDWKGLTHIVISHFHTDHFGDLAPILWAMTHGIPGGREHGLILAGPPGIRRVVQGLAVAHGSFVIDPGFPLEIVELGRSDRWEDPWQRLSLLTHPTVHTEESIALRLETGEGSVGYTGDTGPDPSLGEFFRGVELLICECAVPDPTQMVNHLSPRSAGEIARIASPRTLILTHAYPEIDRAALPDLLRSEGYTGEVLVGSDGMRMRVTGLWPAPAS